MTEHSLHLFEGTTLFHHLGRTLCRAGCLPRKELFETWEMARRLRRVFRGGRIIDLAAGHGLLAYALLLLDDRSPSAIAVDTRIPPSAERIKKVLEEEWPKLKGRVSHVEADIEALPVPLLEGDLLVSSHACGPLTDRVLDLAIAHRARVAVLPCCHPLPAHSSRGLGGWVDGALAIDIARAQRLEAQGFEVRTMTIPLEISPKNRLLLATPSRHAVHGEHE